MDTFKYSFCLWLIIASAIQANPATTPSVEVSAEELQIAAGGSGSVTCTPRGNPLPSVQWRKHDGEFGAGVAASGNTLTIGGAQDSDGGYYQCVGLLGTNVIAGKYVYVEIETSAAPLERDELKVIVSQRTLSIPRGGSGSIECTPEGNPLPSVQWIKSDGEFRAGIKQSGNTLIISDARVQDRGHYVCQGIVDGTVVLTNYSAVEIGGVSQTPSASAVKLILSERQVRIPEGGNGTIECTPEGDPMPRVQWIKSDGEFRKGISQSGNTLIISDARMEDRGHYACQGIVDGTVMLTNYSAVDIERISQRPPTRNLKLIVSERQVRIPEGGNGTIECTPEGDPLPIVQWIKSNGEFRNGISQSGNTLIISDARMEDRGHYACQGIVDGTVMMTNYSAVDIERVSQRPPTRNLKLIVSERQVRIPEGGNGTIECTPEGDPLPSVQWIKSNGEFRNGIIQSGNTLIISDARMEDRGHYACQGIVDGTVMLTNYSAVDIERVSQRPPTRNLKLIVSERQVRIPEGGNGTIECTPEGDPLPSVQWIKSNGEFRNGIIQSGNTLIISDARMEDRGHYACQGIVDGTVMLTNYSAVDIERVSQRPPTRNLKLIVSERQVRIPEGGNGTIECTPEGDPLPSVQWIKSNGEFRNGISQSGNTLIISDARMEDRGHYACQGIVDGTVMLTNYSAVDITRGPQPPPVTPQTPPPVTQQTPQTPQTPENPKVIVSERQLSIPLGGRRTIECTPEGNPLPTVQWIKADGEFRDGIGQSENTLIISDAREEDQGHYACQGIVDGTVVDTSYTKIEIENDKGITEDIPHPLEIVILEGADSRIICDFVTGDLEQDVTWTRRDQRPLPETAQEGNELIILSATKDDAGEYVCRVSASRGGFPLRTAHVRVAVRAPPLLTVRPLSQSVRRGEAAALECVVDGESQVTWERVNGVLSSRVDYQGSTLYFDGVEEEDAGYYRCSAQNEAGISSGIAQVSVNDVETPTPSPGYLKLIVSERQLIIPTGGSGSIECTPEGNPLPKVQWIKSNGEFHDRIRQSGNTLIISDARIEDRGHYVCQGIVDGTVMLTNYSAVDVRDVAPPTPSSGYLKLIVSERQLIIPTGGSGSIECTPEGNPLPKVQWIKSNGEFRNGISQSGNTLVISDARIEDRGHYACQGIVDGTVMLTNYSAVDVRDEPQTPSPANLESSNGEADNSAVETIESDIRPPVVAGHSRVQLNVRKLKIPEGGNGTVECSPEGSPLPTVQWHKHEGDFGVGARQSGNALVISDAQEQDSGYYVCDGMVDGVAAWTDYLSVEIESQQPNSQLVSYPRVTVNMRQLRIQRGGSIAIECTPEGSPLPTIQWSKDGGNFAVGTRQSGNSLVISDAQEEDRGNYVCSAIVNGNAVFSDYLTVEIQYICELPKEVGSCLASFDRWYYDSTQHKCQKFTWGGCGGNKNNFDTEEQCSLECDNLRWASSA